AILMSISMQKSGPGSKSIKYSYSGTGFGARSGDGQKYSRDFMFALLRSMERIRRVEEKIASEYHKDEIKNPVHLMVGQEATCVGLTAAMKKTDLLYLTHRTHGGY